MIRSLHSIYYRITVLQHEHRTEYGTSTVLYASLRYRAVMVSRGVLESSSPGVLIHDQTSHDYWCPLDICEDFHCDSSTLAGGPSYQVHESQGGVLTSTVPT